MITAKAQRTEEGTQSKRDKRKLVASRVKVMVKPYSGLNGRERNDPPISRSNGQRLNMFGCSNVGKPSRMLIPKNVRLNHGKDGSVER